MKDTASVLEADLVYAERMVRSGCATAEQAARTCGVRLPDLQARLGGAKPQPGSTRREELFRSFDM